MTDLSCCLVNRLFRLAALAWIKFASIFCFMFFFSSFMHFFEILRVHEVKHICPKVM